jgi:hypothetical protein
LHTAKPSIVPQDYKSKNIMRNIVSTTVVLMSTLGLAAAWLPQPHPVHQQLPSTSSRSSKISAHRSPATEDETESRSNFFPWSDSNKAEDIPYQAYALDKKDDSASTEEDQAMSPELMKAGVFAASAAIIAGVSTATNFDIRYVPNSAVLTMNFACTRVSHYSIFCGRCSIHLFI